MTRRFELQGHRGARGLFPENTVDGFQAAFALGVTAFELDVGMTADGVVVVTHDLALNPDIARDPTGAWLPDRGPTIRSLTYEALRQYDVGRLRPGSDYAALYAEQRPIDGARIPSLAMVLAAVPQAFFNIEIKTDPRYPGDTVRPEILAEAVLREIDTADAGDRVMIESFDWRGPRHVRTLRPAMRLAWLTRDETVRHAEKWWDRDVSGTVPAAVAVEGGDTWAPHYPDLTRDALDEAHALGLKVIPWTVNDPAAIARLIDWGVDGLISDYPNRIAG